MIPQEWRSLMLFTLRRGRETSNMICDAGHGLNAHQALTFDLHFGSKEHTMKVAPKYVNGT